MLDREAIRERFEGAVVCFNKGQYPEADIVIPSDIDGYYISLVGGEVSTIDWDYPNDEKAWTIRPGDKCEVSNSIKSNFWHGNAAFDGFSGDPDKPIRVIWEDGSQGNWTHIRPLPKDSKEKIEMQNNIDRMKKELADMEARVEGME